MVYFIKKARVNTVNLLFSITSSVIINSYNTKQVTVISLGVKDIYNRNQGFTWRVPQSHLSHPLLGLYCYQAAITDNCIPPQSLFQSSHSPVSLLFPAPSLWHPNLKNLTLPLFFLLSLNLTYTLISLNLYSKVLQYNPSHILSTPLPFYFFILFWQTLTLIKSSSL